jgi:cell division protein FtsN
VQVAAFTLEEDAVRLAKRLRDRGYDARVTTEKPFRVRLGRFARRDGAVQLATKLKVAQTAAIVVEAENP